MQISLIFEGEPSGAHDQRVWQLVWSIKDAIGLRRAAQLP
jgi:hypothetical protein